MSETQQFTNEEEIRSILVDVARQTYVSESSIKEESLTQPKRSRLDQPILFAAFTREHGLQITRITD